MLLRRIAGGMVLGTSLSPAGFVSRLSSGFNMRVLSVDYPLCPEASVVEAVAAGVKAFQYLVEDLHVPANKV